MSHEEHIEIMLRLLGRIRHASDPKKALDDLLSCFAQLLSELTRDEVRALRDMLVAHFAEAEIDPEELVTLIEGHLAYRELVRIK